MNSVDISLENRINRTFLHAYRVKRMIIRACLSTIFSIALCYVAVPLAHADAESLAKERQLYREAMENISRGRSEQAEALLPALHQYALYPYLELELIKAQISELSHGTIDVYLQQYRDTIVGQRIRIAWLYQLRRRGEWAQFVRYYRQDPPSFMRCDYLRALYKQGDTRTANAETEALWQTGRSLPDACDPALKQWLRSLSTAEYRQQHWQRAQLAIEAGQHSLAIYLLRKVPGSDAEIQLLENPALLYQRGFTMAPTDDNRRLALLSLRRLAKNKFEEANTLWHQLDRELGFTNEQNYALRDAFARQIIAGDMDYARDWINANDPTFEDPYLTEWRIRLALKDRDWEAAQRFIALLPAKLRAEPDWQYWWARAETEKQQRLTENASQILRTLATQRGYYSFMAADLLNQQYRLGERRNLDVALLDEVRQHSAVIRARELFWQGELNTARLEWNYAMRSLNTAEKIAAGQLALEWQWPHQAIVTAIRAGEWDDLELRFPMAYREQFMQTAAREEIDPKWIYAIARQESAFAEDARSPVGARGVMQIMPGTARTLARQMGRPTPSRSELLDADTNIAMGGFYLGQLLKRFSGNRILATAAYNAGPSRVERVLMRQNGNMPADIWIENLPYGETRDYIKNVLAFSVVYGEKLELSKPILANHERRISPVDEFN